MEKNPNKATQAIWQASQSPVGEAAAAGVRGAAELTLSAGALNSPHFSEERTDQGQNALCLNLGSGYLQGLMVVSCCDRILAIFGSHHTNLYNGSYATN